MQDWDNPKFRRSFGDWLFDRERLRQYAAWVAYFVAFVVTAGVVRFLLGN